MVEKYREANGFSVAGNTRYPEDGVCLSLSHHVDENDSFGEVLAVYKMDVDTARSMVDAIEKFIKVKP